MHQVRSDDVLGMQDFEWPCTVLEHGILNGLIELIYDLVVLKEQQRLAHTVLALVH